MPKQSQKYIFLGKKNGSNYNVHYVTWKYIKSGVFFEKLYFFYFWRKASFLIVMFSKRSWDLLFLLLKTQTTASLICFPH